MSRLAPALVVALALPALAQQNDWSITRTAGGAVMEEVSALIFTVANTSPTNGAAIQAFSLLLNPAKYDVDGATAPTGWRVATVDRINRKITFRAATACSSTSGLRPGQSNTFELRVIGRAEPADQAGQRLQSATLDEACPAGGRFKNPTLNDTWTLHGLSGEVTVGPRALELGQQIAVTLSVVNRSTQTQTAITPMPPVVRGAATFALVSGPTPAQVNNLAVDGTASFTWVYQATGRGVSTFEVSAGNGLVTSPPRGSLEVSVGTFPAVLTVQPTVTVNGGEVTLQLQVTNNLTTSLTNVTPDPLLVTASGGASATPLSGPTPATVASLTAGTTAGFSYRYRIDGAVGDQVTFTGRGRGTTGTGTLVQTDPVRSGTVAISELTLTPSPESVLSGSGATTIQYRLRNGGPQAVTSLVLLTPDTTLFRTPTATAVPPGWTATASNNPRGMRFSGGSLAPGASLDFSMAYASIGTVNQPTPTTHRGQVTYADGVTTARADARVTVATNRVVPDVVAPVAVAKPGAVQLYWSNPPVHDSVIILRSTGAPPNMAPVQGVRYAKGDLLGNATVVYVDVFSSATSALDTTVTSGTTYYYRFHNRDEYSVYAAGNAPAPAPGNVLMVAVPGTGASQPTWCASSGFPALQQPFTDLGKAIYQSSQARYFFGHVASSTPSQDGLEKWRPSLTNGVVQARPIMQGSALFVGDQQGYAYRVSTGTGAIDWVGNGGQPLGEVIQAAAAHAPRQYSSAAFQATYGTDLAFFATRNSNRSTNSVRALRADTGALVWTYQPGDLDQVTGSLTYDPASATVWVSSLRSAGPSLRVLDAVNPATPLLTVSDLGDIPGGIARLGSVGQMLVVDRAGLARGYHVNSRTQVWQASLGGTVTYAPVTFGTDFIVSSTSGVQRYHYDAATQSVTPVWPAPTPLRLPTPVRVDLPGGKAYLGDADGYVRRLDLATGTIESSVQLSTTGGVSMLSFDSTLRRLAVGTADGRLCALPLTF